MRKVVIAGDGINVTVINKCGRAVEKCLQAYLNSSV